MKKSANKWLIDRGYYAIGGNIWLRRIEYEDKILFLQINVKKMEAKIIIEDQIFITDQTLRDLQIMLNNVKLDVRELKEFLEDTHEHCRTV